MKTLHKMQILLAAALMLGALAGTALADERALTTEDGFVVAPGKVKLQQGLEGAVYSDDFPGGIKPRIFTYRATGKVGVAPNLELDASVGLGYATNLWADDKEFGIGDSSVALKYQVASVAKHGVDASVKLTALLPTGDEKKLLGQDEWQSGIQAVASRTFGNAKDGVVTLQGIAGATVVESLGLVEQLGLGVVVGELDGFHAGFDAVGNLRDGRFELSQAFTLSYPVSPALRADVGVKLNPVIDAARDHYAGTVGVTMMF